MSSPASCCGWSSRDPGRSPAATPPGTPEGRRSVHSPSCRSLTTFDHCSHRSQSMCEPSHATHTAHPVAGVPRDLDAFTGERIPLTPVERVSITSLVDNTFDGLATDTGPAHRPSGDVFPLLASSTTEDGFVIDGPQAEHGFSALVEVERAGGQIHRILFDTGVSPDGMVENMRRLGIDPQGIEVVVCSHGHFDHTAGLDGLARQVGPTNLPVMIHPNFWSRRRTVIPGHDPIEMPTTSRRALVDVGFEIIERQQPSFVF